MALSWNEIKDRAVAFSKEWEDTYNEDADAKPFLEAFFNIFGITRKRVGTFEHRVKKLNEADGYIDLLWKGTILIEMKTKGKNLDKAFIQAKDYIHGIKEHELPKYILVSDFENFRLFDTENQETTEFKLKDLVHNVQHFGFIAGYQKRVYKEQDPVNIKAAALMAKLHDRLKFIGYEGHPLEVYLVRLLFCLFAEDTTIFERQQFQNFIEDRTNEDGSDLASKIQELFQTLNTPNERRFKNLDEQLNAFPYVNGKLFEEVLPFASFDSAMRVTLLECCYIDWSKISPAIFGSMFQGVMNPQERRNLGAHYTSEKNILKLIKPLFLDELWKEFNSIKDNKNKLPSFHKKLSLLKFLDPACGCGNFLVITYRELRLLEIEILRYQFKNQIATSIESIIWLDVDQFYGIEFEEFPARIAEVAMWLIDHQMNMQISSEFGQYFVRLPLRKSATILNADALETDWNTIVNKEELSYIIGNPPFIGSKLMTAKQRGQIVDEFGGLTGSGTLDYVSGWYMRAVKFIQGTKTKVAFVSTNSIVQGEQVALLWRPILQTYGGVIHFAHRTFKWVNEARGNAGVYCVIIGFATFDTIRKTIYEYEDVKGEAHEIVAKHINPYLIDATDTFISKRTKSISNAPKMFKGSQPTDGGNFLFTEDEVIQFLNVEPMAKKFVRPLISAHEFLNGLKRYCLWLVDANPTELLKLPQVMNRINAVKTMRLNSTKIATVQWARQPTLFTENRQPSTEYILIPSHSSESRPYIPMGFMTSNDILNNSCLSIPDASLYHFGILMSQMHMSWLKTVCGRLESRYRYSIDIVYNNYPWPRDSNKKQIEAVSIKAQHVLDVRSQYMNSSLSDLYNPLTMPVSLQKAHSELDKVVDLAYRPQPFINEMKRLEFLFDLYEQYTADLFDVAKKIKIKK
ncbi:DNA methyltransferase [Pedobacter sp. Leaf132]|uniref:class I SAM-dependent DNA methyltransferase n=1 Tax=Pedobacter sp. Leaf132 TaxID=2876557 RepID=UPI001E5B82D7|nr:DNA methyltransferase [Pedobacter sp. Leaf132]